MKSLKPIGAALPPRKDQLVKARAAAPTSEIIQPKAQDRLYELIEREQLPGDVRDTLAGALTGDLPRQQLLFQAMIDTWPRLQKNLNEVARSVSSTPWEILPYSERGDEATDSAIEKADLVHKAIENMAPRPAWDELSERGLVKSLVHGYYMGHQVCEIFWDRTSEGTMPRSAKVVAPRYYDYPDDGEDRLMFLPNGGYYTGNFEEFPEHHFMLAINSGHSGHASISAPLRALTGYWLAATFGLKWLLQFTQLYGVPFRFATYEDETVRTKVCNMLENIGSSGWGAFPKGTEIEFVEASKSADSLPQAMLLEMADKQCDTFILGQTLTTDVGDSGSRALGDVHQEVRAGVIQGVNDFVSDIFNHQLVPSIISLNYGNKDELPCYKATVEAPKDEIAMAQRDQTLISMGMEVGKEWLYERHGVPMPEDGDTDTFQPSGGNGGQGEPDTGDVQPNETDPAEADDSDEEIEASMVRAYDPSQKRAEKGSDNGGQWVADNSKGGGEKKSSVSEAESKRYSELEAKFNEGTITDEELGEAHDLVEKAAKAAGYNTEKVYHGTDTEFEVFDDKELGTATDSESAEKAFFFSDDEKTAKAYANWAAEEGPVKEALAEADRAEKIGDWDAYDKAVIKSEELAASAYKRRMAKARVIPAYLKGNFLEVDAEGATPQELKGSGGDIDFGISSKLDEAKEGGYDGVIFRNLDDAVGLYDRPSDHYAVFNPNQIKSADIFTGTPLAERFNQDDDRITFSHAVQAYDPNQKRAKDGRWTDGAISRGVIDKVERSHIDSYDGQDDYELVAYKGDDIMGYLSYSEHEGDVSISMVETRETHKRKGIATELYKELVKLHGEKAISSSFATKDGSALRKALEKRGIIKKDGTVIKSSNAVKAYDPNQKRGEKGSPDGGRWVDEDGGDAEDKMPTSAAEMGLMAREAADYWDEKEGFYDVDFPITPEEYQKNFGEAVENKGIISDVNDPFRKQVNRELAVQMNNEEFNKFLDAGPKFVVIPYKGEGLSPGDFGRNSMSLGNAAGMTVRLNKRAERMGYGIWGEEVDPGSGNIGVDVGSVIRHEYGHIFWQNAMSKDQRTGFFDKVKDASIISRYAESSNNEVFPEALALVTHPKFDKNKYPNWVGEMSDWMKKELTK